MRTFLSPPRVRAVLPQPQQVQTAAASSRWRARWAAQSRGQPACLSVGRLVCRFLGGFVQIASFLAQCPDSSRSCCKCSPASSPRSIDLCWLMLYELLYAVVEAGCLGCMCDVPPASSSHLYMLAKDVRMNQTLSRRSRDCKFAEAESPQACPHHHHQHQQQPPQCRHHHHHTHQDHAQPQRHMPAHGAAAFMQDAGAGP